MTITRLELLQRRIMFDRKGTEPYNCDCHQICCFIPDSVEPELSQYLRQMSFHRDKKDNRIWWRWGGDRYERKIIECLCRDFGCSWFPQIEPLTGLNDIDQRFVRNGWFKTGADMVIRRDAQYEVVRVFGQ